MKSASVLVAVLLALEMSALGWTGPASNKSASELEQMSDQELVAEALGPCTESHQYGPAAIQYLQSIAQVARQRRNGERQDEFSDILLAAALESPDRCQKAVKAARQRNTAQRP